MAFCNTPKRQVVLYDSLKRRGKPRLITESIWKNVMNFDLEIFIYNYQLYIFTVGNVQGKTICT
jgi:hypothetical protein